METNKILDADVLDIIFDGRNKEYGAYQLRKNYNRRLAYSLSVMFGIALLAVGGTVLGKTSDTKRPVIYVKDYTLTSVVEPPVQPPTPPPPPVKEIKIKEIKVTPPLIVKEQVTVPPPKVSDVEDVKIGTENVEGIKSDNVVAAPVEISTVAAKPLIKQEDYTGIFINVQQEAKFPGGPDAWMKYLGRNLRQDVPTDNGAAAGDYKIVVSFLVDKDGNVTEVKAENDPGFGIADEAIRVIQRSGKWQAALQNGRNVIYRQKQQITFRVAE